MARMTFTDLPIRFQSFSIENEKHSKATWSFNKAYWSEDESIVSVAQTLFEQYKKSLGSKIRTTKLEADYFNTMIVILCNVAAIYESGRDGIAVKLGSNEFTCQLRKYEPIRITRTVFKNLINWLSASGYIHLYVAPRGKKSESCSVIEILPSIIELLDLDYFDRDQIEVHPEFSFVHKTVAKKLVDFISTADTEYRNSLIKKYNKLLNKTDITIDGKPILKPVCLTSRLIRNERSHGRIYGGYWINCKSELRKSIKIDGCATIEFDIANSTLRLAANLNGVDLPMNDDLYDLGGYERQLIKDISRSLQNIEAKYLLNGLQATTTSIHEEFLKKIAQKAKIRAMTEGEDGEHAYKKVLSRLRKEKNSKELMSLHGVPFTSRELRKVVDAVYEKHRCYAGNYLLCDRGLELMFEESKVTFKVIEEFLRLNEIVLTIHDSYIVKTSNKQLLEEVIQRSYKDLTGFLPKLKCK